jgi:metal-responsive CopG/Arc/MetJ family transcriptional regulator
MAKNENDLVFIGFRCPKLLIKKLDEVIEVRPDKPDRSVILREAVARYLAELSFLTPEEKKALGIREITTREALV